MTVLPFPEYRPDVSTYETDATGVAQNVVARADGYGPFKTLADYTQALGATCRGYFQARNTDGTITIFAGTSTRLYKLDNTALTWTDVSKGATDYSTLPSTGHWQFAQFGSIVVAVQINTKPQSFTLGSSSAFGDLSADTNMPQASYVSVVGRFLVLSGLSAQPYRIQWSGLNSINGATSWTSGTNSSDFQDLPDGGIVRGVAGGEYGVIFQETTMRRMVYAPNTAFIFQIERITEDKGLLAPYSIIRAGDRIFFLAPQGFYEVQPGGYPSPIGKEKFDRTFFADYDSGNLQLIIGASDPAATRVYWAYKSQAGQAGLFDKVQVWDYALGKGSTLVFTGEYLATMAAPGATLEGMDGPALLLGTATTGISVSSASPGVFTKTAHGYSTGQGHRYTGTLAAGISSTTTYTVNVLTADTWKVSSTNDGATFVNTTGSSAGSTTATTVSIDALSGSFDAIATSALPQISAVSSAHKLGFFTGVNMEAALETSEQAMDDSRMRAHGFRPITDASGCYGSIGQRERLQDSVTYSMEQQLNARGLIPANVDTRLARARLRIPASTTWTFARGVEPDADARGKR